MEPFQTACRRGEQVAGWCATALASYKVPATVEFRDSLPYTQTGKLLKQELEPQEESHVAGHY